MADEYQDDEPDAPADEDALHLAFALAQHHVDLDALPDGEFERMLAEMKAGDLGEAGA